MRKRRLYLALGIVAALLIGMTVPGSSAPGDPVLHFNAAGDYSAGSNASAVFNTIGALDADLHIALGDLSYGATGAEQAWCDFVTQRVGAGYPFELVAGNHESNGQNGNINDFSACLPNQLPGVVGTYGRQYYVDSPNDAPLVRFVMISPALTFPDGTWSYAAGTARYNWTAAAIDDARADGIPWVVVAMHKPCLSLGEYTCEVGPDLINMLLAKRVDVVLAGHEHLYQRTKQIATGPGCASLSITTYSAACVADADNDLAKGAGTVFATVGTGGQTLRDVDTSDPALGYFAATSGSNQNPTWGVLDFTATADVLSASFQRASGGTFADAFTITQSGGNTPPIASFTPTCTALSCQFNANGSSDPGGSIAEYTWDFGDSTSGSGVMPTHPYAVPGTYPVTLTVTDNEGLESSATTSVTVSNAVTFASDDFARTATNGWGAAPVGGAWTPGGGSASFSVSGGQGRMVLPTAGAGRTALLNGVSRSATDLSTIIATDKMPTGSGLYVSVIGRRVAGAGEYRAKVQLLSTGVARLSLVRTNASGAETTIASAVNAPGVTYALGDRLNVRLQVTGTSPTLIRAKVWEVGTTEPAAWLVSVNDTTAAMQAAGAIGYFGYLSGSATNAPVTVLYDNVAGTAP